MKNQLLDKVRKLLDAVAAAKEPVSLKELSGQLEMPVATVSRIASDLVEMKMLAKSDYHHLIPGMAQLRLADEAGCAIPFLQEAAGLMQEFFRRNGMELLLLGWENGRAFKQLFCGNGILTRRSCWRTGAMTMLLADLNFSPETARERFLAENPEASTTERLVFEREYEIAQREKALMRVIAMRQWSFSLPVNRPGLPGVLAVFGEAPEGYFQQQFKRDAQFLASRLGKIR